MRASIIVLLIALWMPGLEPSSQELTEIRALPRPTGAFAVGRVTRQWIDRAREEPRELGGGPRQLVVHVWYPADSATGAPAAYLDPSAFENPRSAERLRGLLRGAYDTIRDGRVRTHATEDAAFNRSIRRAPVLIFSHGGGEARETYSAQLADLASHGYVVAAISHTHEAVLTLLRDGTHVTLASRRWPRPTVSRIAGLPPSQEANPDRLRWWADDMRFVIDRLTKANDARPAVEPFAGRLDLDRIGAFGHSAGGQAAAQACQIERRLRACLNQDGLAAFAPYYLDDSDCPAAAPHVGCEWGMNQSFMLMVRNTPREEPSQEDLAAMKMTREQAHELIAQLQARQDASLQRTGDGAYRVLIDAARTTHADFGDLPVLQATTATEANVRAQILESIRIVTRSFFDKTLKGVRSPVLEGRDLPPFVEAVQAFEPAKRQSNR